MSWDLWITVELAEKTKCSVAYQRTKFSFRALNTWISRQTLKAEIILMLGYTCKSRTTKNCKLTYAQLLPLLKHSDILHTIFLSASKFLIFIFKLLYSFIIHCLWCTFLLFTLFSLLRLLNFPQIHLYFCQYYPVNYITPCSWCFPLILWQCIFSLNLFPEKSLLMTCTTQLYTSSVTNTMKV